MKRLLAGLAGLAVIVVVLYACWRLMEYVSFRVLYKKGLVSEQGVVNANPYGAEMNFWAGGLENSKNFVFSGIDASLNASGSVRSDENGFVTGDSMPLSREKPINTIRIFLTGGSAMWGSVQNWNLVSSHSYPQGTYVYEASIAGRLRARLERQFPDIHFQVINAAVMGHQFNQSYAAYYERIHDFHPDIIINMDGRNDEWIATDFENHADPYEATLSQGEVGVKLEMLKRSSKYGYTFMLLNSLLLQKSSNEKGANSSVQKHRKEESATPFISPHRQTGRINVEYPQDSFQLVKPFMVMNMQKQLWIIQSYEWQLAHDSVYSIFVLQPTLARLDKQKKLSAKEQQLYHEIFGNETNSTNRAGFDSLVLSIRPINNDFMSAVYKMGDAKYFIPWYYQCYFIGNYISPAIDSIVTRTGGAYIDANKQIDTLPATTDFFVDYCHLTPYGNEYMAGLMFDGVKNFVNTKFKKELIISRKP